MDLERIKQNLRLRSGRSKKTRKQPIAPSNPSNQTAQPEQKHVPNGDAPPPDKPTAQSKSNEEQPPEVDQSQKLGATESSTTSNPATIEDPQGTPPQTSIGTNLKSPAKEQSTRFGKSGMERPQKDSTKESALSKSMSQAETSAAAQEDDSSSALDFDLRPPPPRPKSATVEVISESLFSSGHLDTLLRDSHYLMQFTSFLTRYRPQYHPVLLRYLETQKAIKAVEYANAVAEGLSRSADDNAKENSAEERHVAAALDSAFAESSNAAFRLMVESALPMYVTYHLVKVVTECLINEITGRRTPLMKDLVGGLSEVFCLADPKQEDTPIIYASEEFFRYTGYGADDVLGRNCRFLQGSKTNKESTSRLRESIGKGEGICETLLNYRRDGRPFLNLLMIAPLHDDKGNVKYHFGAQVDVTGLVSRGKGLDGFERYMISQEMKRRKTEIQSKDSDGEEGFRKSRALAKLRELSEMFDLEESAVVRSHSRSTSVLGDDDENSIGSSRRGGRRVLGEADTSSDNDDEETADDKEETWKLGQSGRSGLSGKLPGVYESYVLVRPAPSLRIIFVSPKLRRRLGNIVQQPLLSHVAASTNTLKGLKESFSNGEPVSAKINFLLEAGKGRDGTVTRPGSRLEEAGHGRICWISATPMLGSDDKIGVWMVVVVEKARVPTISRREALVSTEEAQVPQQAGQNQKSTSASPRQKDDSASTSPPPQNHDTEDGPIKPRKLEDTPEPTQSIQSPQGSHAEEGMSKAEECSERQDHQYVEQGAKVNGVTRESEDSNRSGPINHTEDEFVKAKTELPAPESSDPADIAEGADDNSTRSANEAASKGRESRTAKQQPAKARVRLESPEANDIQDDADIYDDPSDHEGTITNDQPEELSDDTPSSSRPGTSGKDVASQMSNPYMDYLRHPGSRPSSGEYSRVVSGSFLSGRYDAKEGDQSESEEFQDPDCLSSPYSVD